MFIAKLKLNSGTVIDYVGQSRKDLIAEVSRTFDSWPNGGLSLAIYPAKRVRVTDFINVPAMVAELHEAVRSRGGVVVSHAEDDVESLTGELNAWSDAICVGYVPTGPGVEVTPDEVGE